MCFLGEILKTRLLERSAKAGRWELTPRRFPDSTPGHTPPQQHRLQGEGPRREETASAILGEPEEVGERTAHSRNIQGRALSQAPSNPHGAGH